MVDQQQLYRTNISSTREYLQCKVAPAVVVQFIRVHDVTRSPASLRSRTHQPNKYCKIHFAILTAWFIVVVKDEIITESLEAFVVFKNESSTIRLLQFSYFMIQCWTADTSNPGTKWIKHLQHEYNNCHFTTYNAGIESFWKKKLYLPNGPAASIASKASFSAVALSYQNWLNCCRNNKISKIPNFIYSFFLLKITMAKTSTNSTAVTVRSWWQR